MSCIYKYRGKDYTKDEFYSLVRTTMVQPRTVQKYEKVLFPTGDTASKIEGHTTLEEFKKQKEDRIKQLEEQIKQANTLQIQNAAYIEEDKYIILKLQEDGDIKDVEVSEEEYVQVVSKQLRHEINQIKQEIERVDREGFGTLKPIYKFYEETIGNILKKQYKDKINRITDEYGNDWWELEIDKNRDLSDIMLQLSSEKSFEITPELKSRLEEFVKAINPDFKIEVLDDLVAKRGLNGLADIRNFTIQLQRGKESALAEEATHFFIELLKEDNPLKKVMRDEVTRTRLYKQVVKDYKEIYGNDVDRLKREAMAKLVSMYLHDKEGFKYWVGSDSLIENIIRWIKDFFRWIKGDNSGVDSFIQSAETILRLDTSALDINMAQRAPEMYDIDVNEILKDRGNITTVGIQSINPNKYDKIFVNISDTLLDSTNFPWDQDYVKKEILMGLATKDKMDHFFNTVNLTNLGKELKDKISTIPDAKSKFVFFTRMRTNENLKKRLQDEFGNIPIEFTHIEDVDDTGKIVQLNQFNEVVERHLSGNGLLITDTSMVNLSDKLESRIFNQSTSRPYVSFEQRLFYAQKIESSKKQRESLIDELKKLDKESVLERIKKAFNILRKEKSKIENLESRLEEMDLSEDDYLSLFRNEQGDLLLPTDKARRAHKLAELIDNYETAISEFVGTIESLTKFFEDRNNSDYSTIKSKLQGTDEDIDIALQELNLVVRMGNTWKDYIDNFRELVKDVPNTKTVDELLGKLSTQIEISRGKSIDLAKEAISMRLAPMLDSYNENKDYQIQVWNEKIKTLTDPEEIKKIEKNIKSLEKTKVSPKDIIDILNGSKKDINGITVYVKSYVNIGDALIGPLAKLLKLKQLEVDASEVASAQELGEKVREIQKQHNLTDKEYQDRIITTGKTIVWEEGMPVAKDTLTLLHPFKNEHTRYLKLKEVNDKRKKYYQLKNSNAPAEEVEVAFKDYTDTNETFESWENKNWHKEYSQEYYERYDRFKQDSRTKELLYKISEIQSGLYSEIEILTTETQYLEGDALAIKNKEIEEKKREIKNLRRKTNSDGTPKKGEDLEIAEILEEKLKEDSKWYEYKSDLSKFRTDFYLFLDTLNLSTEDIATLKIEEDNLTNLINYAKSKNLQPVVDWLELRTITTYSKEYYEERKKITEQISQVIEELNKFRDQKVTTRLKDIWESMFNLTSSLRNEDGIFDGSLASDVIQKKVREFDEEIEKIKDISREEGKSIKDKDYKNLKKQLLKLIEDLSKIQSKTVTDTYLEEFNSLIIDSGFNEIYNNQNPRHPYVDGGNVLTYANMGVFHKTMEANPDHVFTKWFYNNHILKSIVGEDGTVRREWVPTYIWYKIQPSDPKQVISTPSHKYSKRVVKQEHHTEKNSFTWNPALKMWNPKSEEFIDENYKKLVTSTDTKDRGAAKILKLITDYHLKTQIDTDVIEGRLGYNLPYVKRWTAEGNILNNIKDTFFDTSNRYEEGEQNFEDNEGTQQKTGWWNKVKAFFNNQEQEEEEETQDVPTRMMRVAVPFSTYNSPDLVSRDALMSVIMFSASTRKADKMMKSLPIVRLIEQSLQNAPKVDKQGRPTNNVNNRLFATKFIAESEIFGINKRYEIPKGREIDRVLAFIRKANTIGSLGFSIGNVVKNNLQGRLQNTIGSQFGDWSSNKSMRKAAADFKNNFIWFISQGDKPLEERDINFHILTFFNPTLDSNIYKNLIQGSKKRSTLGQNLDHPILMFNEMMEYSIVSNLLFGHLYHVKVKNQKGEEKYLKDIFKVNNNKLTVEEGWIDKKGKTIDNDYLNQTKLAYHTVLEYVQGRVTTKNYLSTTIIGQTVLYFKNWLLPMLRRRFDVKRPNYMIGEDLEGYWMTFLRLSKRMLVDMAKQHKSNWNYYTEEEKRNYTIALKEMAFMAASLAILSMVFGFDSDDPDKFKKIKKNSFAENFALLMLIQAKNETEALSLMPMLNTETSLVPPVLTEGSRWIKNPTIGFSIVDNAYNTFNLIIPTLLDQETAYYQKNMPQFNIEKGDSKLMHYLLKTAQIDDLLINEDPEQKLRTVIANMKR